MIKNHGLNQLCSGLRLSENRGRKLIILSQEDLTQWIANWNIGCKASEVFTQLEFQRKNKCVFKKPRALQNLSQWAVNMHQADHSLWKQSRYELRNVNANADIPESQRVKYLFFFFLNNDSGSQNFEKSQGFLNTNRFASAVRLSDRSRVHQPEGNLLYKLCRVIFLYLAVLKINN